MSTTWPSPGTPRRRHTSILRDREAFLGEGEVPSRGRVNRNMPIRRRLRTCSPAREATNRQAEKETSLSLTVFEFSKRDMSIPVDPDLGCRQSAANATTGMRCKMQQHASSVAESVSKAPGTASFSNVFEHRCCPTARPPNLPRESPRV
jgi:hypothetical protein